MWKLDFFLLPSTDYEQLGINEAIRLEDNLIYLQENEHIAIPNEFYDIEDKNHLTICDYIYNMEQNEFSDYLLEIIWKLPHSDITYEEVDKKEEKGYLAILHEDISNSIESICVEKTYEIEKEKQIEVNDVIKVKRYYLNKVDSYKIYQDRAESCFPSVIFHKDAFKYISKMGKCSDVVQELTRHLAVLNDAGKKLYEYNGKNEKVTLDMMKSTYNIECSGKGSKEEASFNKEMEYLGKNYLLTCNPHTKLFNRHSAQRIYFCWGREEIRKHSLIIARIGNHWEEG